jgi:hypothetical protein
MTTFLTAAGMALGMGVALAVGLLSGLQGADCGGVTEGGA